MFYNYTLAIPKNSKLVSYQIQRLFVKCTFDAPNDENKGIRYLSYNEFKDYKKNNPNK